jgi:predicted CoA-substrate-specific enzyme activase
MYSIGLDIGYSTVKLVVIDQNKAIKEEAYQFHKGNIKKTVLTMIESLPKGLKDKIKYGGVTGSAGKRLCGGEGLHFLNEATALIEGAKAISKEAQSIIEIGGESAKFITNFNGVAKQGIHIAMNSNCAAGTGSYLEEQMSRLNLQLEDYSRLAAKAKSVPRIAGRCSVFAKTDITHHQQEGTSVEDILLGLAYAVVRNYKGTVIKKTEIKKPVLFTGGVTFNQGIIMALKDVLQLDEGDLIIPSHSGSIGALGVAIMSLGDSHPVNVDHFVNKIHTYGTHTLDDPFNKTLKPLGQFGNDQTHLKHISVPLSVSLKKIPCYLGVDVGSTSTNFVLMNANKEIIAHDYSRTLGQPIQAAREGLKNLKKMYGDYVEIKGVGITGSGRYMIGDLIGADLIKDEITAQAKAAVTLDPEVDTIFEIGGQDSKYIQLNNGAVVDFQMNKICAAGTGSFIEEQAKKFNIKIEDFGGLALESTNVIGLGERCTVFMETCIASNLSKGKKIEDIASGLCYAIVQNYLGRVVGQKKVGKKIMFQGGVAYNQGVVNAFKALTDKEIIVPPFFSVTGAYGAALLTQEECRGKATTFKGFEVEDKASFMLRKQAESKVKPDVSAFNEENHALLFKGYTGDRDPNKKTVGIPRALFSFGLYSMFSGVFESLGYNVVLSDPTSEKTVGLGQRYTLDEACYPMKIIMGHVAELIEKKVDYIFFLDLHSVDHPSSNSRANYGCAYMQMAFKLVEKTMDLVYHVSQTSQPQL